MTHQVLPGPQLRRARAPVEAPAAERVDDRQGLDAGLGEAVPDPLSSRRIVADEDACGDESLQPVGEDVRGDPLEGPGEQLTEVAAVPEDDVTQHEHRPVVAERLDRDVDGTSGTGAARVLRRG